MELFSIAIIFIFGTLIGSFLNVVAYRYNSGVSPLKGRSRCFACGKTLSWHELIPIASFVFQRGRCRSCLVKLSWQYPVVEVVTGALFVGVYALGKPLASSLFALAIFCTLVIIAVYDLRHKIIPDSFVILFAVLALTNFFWTIDFSRAFDMPYAWTLIAGPMLFSPFWVLWAVSDGRWIGLGDGKLSLGIGWFLGATAGGSAVILGFWIGAAFAFLVMLAQHVPFRGRGWPIRCSRHLSMQSEIPFGPFLILGVFIVYFAHVNFFDGSTMIFSIA
jgi:prepilin signal peptidase PulO-like enzyme (type II secretory pathway)